jgi:uncharacterized membrane protein
MITTTRARRTTRLTSQTAAVGGLALAGLIIYAGNYHVAAGENGGLGPAIITAVGCLLVSALVHGLVLPRRQASNRAAIILGTLAALSLVVFWSGLTPVLAGAAVAATSDAGGTSRGARVAQVAGGIATAAALAATLATSHLF